MDKKYDRHHNVSVALNRNLEKCLLGVKRYGRKGDYMVRKKNPTSIFCIVTVCAMRSILKAPVFNGFTHDLSIAIMASQTSSMSPTMP